MAIVLFTDFGAADIYLGQVKAVLQRFAPGEPVIDLANDLSPFEVRAAAHLLDALKDAFDAGSVFVCVVDPGVGTARGAAVLEAEGRRYVGPDNGLMSVVASRAPGAHVCAIDWRPARLSDSFHGRDLFAPVAAHLAAGSLPTGALRPVDGLEVSFGAADLEQVVHIDHYGNAGTGIRAGSARPGALLVAGGDRIAHARVFGEAPEGAAFWHVNSHGLVEIAVNRGDAAKTLGLRVGQAVGWAS